MRRSSKNQVPLFAARIITDPRHVVFYFLVLSLITLPSGNCRLLASTWTMENHARAAVGSSSQYLVDEDIVGRTEVFIGPTNVYGGGEWNFEEYSVHYAASVVPSAMQLMRLAGSYSAQFDKSRDSYVRVGTTWQDVIYLHGPDPLPDTIALRFNIGGFLEVDPILSDTSQAKISFLGNDLYTDTPADPISTSGRPGVGAAVSMNQYQIYLHDSNWHNYAGEFQWTKIDRDGLPPLFHFSGTLLWEFEYHKAFEGYAFSVSSVLDLVVSGKMGGKAEGDFGNTVSLGGVMFADGAPLEGYDISFASGMDLSPVPEPSTLITWLGLSGIGLLAAYRRRKRNG